MRYRLDLAGVRTRLTGWPDKPPTIDRTTPLNCFIGSSDFVHRILHNEQRFQAVFGHRHNAKVIERIVAKKRREAIWKANSADTFVARALIVSASIMAIAVNHQSSASNVKAGAISSVTVPTGRTKSSASLVNHWQAHELGLRCMVCSMIPRYVQYTFYVLTRRNVLTTSVETICRYRGQGP